MKISSKVHFFLKENWLVMLILGSCLVISFNIIRSIPQWNQISYGNQFTKLASSFVNGKLDITNYFQGDIALFNSKKYVYFGPFPALLFIPLTIVFGENIPEQLILLFILPLVFYSLYKIAQAQYLNQNFALWLSLFFVFGTIFWLLWLLPIDAYLVQVVGSSLVIFSLYEFFHKKRWWLISTYLACAIATRATLLLACAFFILELWFDKRVNQKSKLLNLRQFLVPVGITIVLLSLYNFARFGSIFDTGYAYNSPLSTELQATREYGLFSLAHIPGNLFLLLFKSPDPVRISNLHYVLKFPFLKADYWGMGIFITTPLFLFVFLTKLRDKYVFSAWVTILLLLIPSLLYYGYGIWQYGYRYGVDFYPFLFILLGSVLKPEFQFKAKILIIWGIVLNFYLMLSMWGIYPPY